MAEGASGDEAIALAEEFRPSLMLLDASMPGLDGLSALPAILGSSPATRVVLFSGFSSPALERTARNLGAVDVIDKGAPIRHLPDRLLQVMGATEASEHRATGLPAAGEDGRDNADLVLGQHLERFRTVFDQGAIGMATMTITGTLVRANPALCTMLGTTEEALVGHPLCRFPAATGRLGLPSGPGRSGQWPP